MSCSVSAADVAIYRVNIKVRGTEDSRRLVVDTITDSGPRKIDGDSLTLLSETAGSGVSLRLWLPDALTTEERGSIAAPIIQPDDPTAAKMFWAPMGWARTSLQHRFGTPLPDFEVDLILVPRGTRLRHKARLPIGERLPMRFALDAPAPTDAPWVAELLLLRAHAIAAHEYFHLLVALGGSAERFPNRTSEEAVAYLFGTCATLESGAFDQTTILSNVPPDPEWLPTAEALSSRALWRSFANHHGLRVGQLETTHRGAILASLALSQAAGGERFVRSEAARSGVARLCEGIAGNRSDWIRSRPRFD